MRLDEITKSEFVEKLKDPASAELRDIIEQVKKELDPDWSISFRGAGKFPTASIHAWNNSLDIDALGDDGRKQHKQLENKLTYLFMDSTYWKLQGWSADASGTIFSARRKDK